MASKAAGILDDDDAHPVAGATKAPPKGEGWICEVKLDGYRFQVVKDGDRVRLYSRSGAEYTDRLPRMVEAFAKLPARAAVLDGNGADGQAKFYRLMHEMRTRRPDESALVLFCFDLLHQDGVDLRGLALSERKRDLARLCRKARVPFLRQVEGFPTAQALFEHACSYGFEGIVSKRLASRYTSGPTRNWAKVKNPAWNRTHVEVRRRIFEKPAKPPAMTEAERTLARRREELARVQNRLQAGDLRPGIAQELRKQPALIEREIAELEATKR